MTEDEATVLRDNATKYEQLGYPETLAKRIACLSTVFSAMDVAEIAHNTQQDFNTVGRLYFFLGAKLNLHWFLNQINGQPVANHWQALARAALAEHVV